MNDTAAIDPQRRRFLRDTALVGLGAAWAGAARAAVPDDAVLATVRGGRLRGYRERGVAVFKGIPYGADTAAYRFQPPRPESPWRGVREATAYGPASPQPKGEEPSSEDCLRLNVWTPALRDGRRRPILFYIHGGAYNNGSGSSPLYDGTNLCRRGDVVVVTVNHRLNAFGYLYLAPFSAAFADAGNVGQLDLIQALQWVREHAHEFGGDADNITVFGQSGGGAKIATLMAMPAARGLFHRAWTMSGQQVTACGPRAARQRAELVLEALKIAPADVARLATLPAAQLIAAAQVRDPSRAESTSLYLGPVLDARSLPAHPFWPQAPAQSATLPMVIGNTRDETRAFLGHDPKNFALTWDDLPAKLEAQQYVDLPTQVVIAEYRRLYPQYSPSDVFFAATTAGRSWRGAIEELEARARQDAPTWAYQLDWHSPLQPQLGAYHTLDIPLVFDNVQLPEARTGDGDEARAMAARMSEALLAFARGGDPRHAGLPHWDRYDLQRRQTMVFDTHTRQEDDPRGGERRLYAQVPFVQRGTF